MRQQYSTRQVAQNVLGVKPSCLSRAVWDGSIPAPQKCPAGNFMWTVRDIEAAAWALKRQSKFQAWLATHQIYSPDVVSQTNSGKK